MYEIIADTLVSGMFLLLADGETRACGNRENMERMIAEDKVPKYWGENCGNTEREVWRECQKLEDEGIDTGMYRA